jgi:Lsr2
MCAIKVTHIAIRAAKRAGGIGEGAGDMAKRTVAQLVDDLDGSLGDERLMFGLEGVTYEVDLNAENAKLLRGMLAPFISGGRRLSASNGNVCSVTPPAPATATKNFDEVRKWARANGYSVAVRGRVSRLVMDAYASGTPASDNLNPNVLSPRDIKAAEAKAGAAEAAPAEGSEVGAITSVS